MTTTLKDVFASLQILTFPSSAESDDLANWITELAEFDGYVAGIATMLLSRGDADTSSLEKQMGELMARLDGLHQCIPAEDTCIYDECKRYAATLKDVIKSIRASG